MRTLPIALFVAAALLSLSSAPAAAQIYNLPRPDTTGAETFGVSVAVDGNVAVVGASGEAACGENAGAVYVYEQGENAPWVRTARLQPSECRANAFFGETVDVSGSRILVSASSEFFAYEKSNAAYVFERAPDGTWRETARLTSPVDRDEGVFADGVALDGDRAVVTTSGNVDGAYGGAVYVFDYDSAADRWRRTARLTASRGTDAGVLGGPVALNGNRLAVAASTYFRREPGSIYVFEYNPADDAWAETAILGGVDDFFISLALHGDRLLVGESRAGKKESGAATLFRRANSGTWARETTLRPSTQYESGAFGSAVSLDDGWALVTGYDEQLGRDSNIDRVVFAFREQDDGTWAQRTIIDIGEVGFGAALDQDGRSALISSVPEGTPGAAYIVRLN